MAQTLQRTPLHARHVALGARMVPFAGWEMPVQYDGVIPEHKAVRLDCGVFDVSHMGELEVEGPQARAVLQSLLANDIGPETDAISAALGWVCALETEFTGADELRRIKEEGPSRRLAAFVMEERAIPRHGMPIEEGGEVTSGSHSPMLDRGIGLGYVPSGFAEPDTELTIDVRGRPR